MKFTYIFWRVFFLRTRKLVIINEIRAAITHPITSIIVVAVELIESESEFPSLGKETLDGKFDKTVGLALIKLKKEVNTAVGLVLLEPLTLVTIEVDKKFDVNLKSVTQTKKVYGSLKFLANKVFLGLLFICYKKFHLNPRQLIYKIELSFKKYLLI